MKPWKVEPSQSINHQTFWQNLHKSYYIFGEGLIFMNISTFLQLLSRLFMLKEIQKHLLPLFLLADCQIGGWTEPQTFIKFCDIQNTKLGSISAWNWLFLSATGVLGFALFGWVVLLRLCWNLDACGGHICKWWKGPNLKSHLHQKGDTHVRNMKHVTQC